MPHAALHDLPALVSLLAPDNEAERESIDPQEISQALTMSVDEMLARLDVAIHQIALDSRVMADLFWEEQLDRFEQKDPGVLGVRVRVNKGTLEIAYFRNAFTRKGTSKRTALRQAH